MDKCTCFSVHQRMRLQQYFLEIFSVCLERPLLFPKMLGRPICPKDGDEQDGQSKHSFVGVGSTAVRISIGHLPQDTASNRCLHFDRIGARYLHHDRNLRHSHPALSSSHHTSQKLHNTSGQKFGAVGGESVPFPFEKFEEPETWIR